MKKPQANFVVEYKGARRKIQPKANSIWGNVDLRSYADDSASLEAKDGSGDIHAASPEQTSPDDVSSISARTPTSPPAEVSLSDRQDLHRTSDAEHADRPTPQEKSKKDKPIVETETVAIPHGTPPPGKLGAPSAVPKQRNPRKTALKAKSSQRSERIAKNAPTKDVETHPVKAAKNVTVSSDAMEDLLQLEQENKELRKLLIEKLRSENALMRARLGLG